MNTIPLIVLLSIGIGLLCTAVLICLMFRLAAVESLCQRLAEARAELEVEIQLVQAELASIRDKHLRGLKRLAAGVAEREAILRAAIESAPNLFIKPRTVIFHGVKVGFVT